MAYTDTIQKKQTRNNNFNTVTKPNKHTSPKTETGKYEGNRQPKTLGQTIDDTRRFPFTLDDLNRELKSGQGQKTIEIQAEDLREFEVNGLPKEPSFPYLIFLLALVKDISDIVSLGLLGTFSNIIAFIFMRLYLMGKVGFIQRWLYRKYIFTLVLEFIPWVNILPQWTIFVLRAHAKEKKAINELLTSIEKLIIRYSAGEKRYRVLKHFI